MARNRSPWFALTISGVLALVATGLNVWLGPSEFRGYLYLPPILFAASCLPRWLIVLLAISLAWLAEALNLRSFQDPRLYWASLTLSMAGLLVGELVRNRRRHLQEEARLRALLETSPTAIVTVDERGFIDLANRAAVDLMAPNNGGLIGQPIAAFLPGLHNALRREGGPQPRTSMQCLGHRADEEVFSANIWFSTYKEGSSSRLAAIFAETSEGDRVMAAGAGASGQPALASRERAAGFTNREADVLRLVAQGLANKEIASQTAASESAVKHAIQQLFAKTGVRTRGQLVRVALEQYRDLL